jgi:hypothetical protein
LYPSHWRQELCGIVADGGDVVDVLNRGSAMLGDRPHSALLFALRDLFGINPLQMNAIYGWHRFGGAVTDEELRQLVPLTPQSIFGGSPPAS